MKAQRRVHRPYVRQRRARREGGAAGLEQGFIGGGFGRPPGRLASLAGSSGRPLVERLENRQLLFAVSITPDDLVNDEIGIVRGFFGYTIPVLLTPEEPDFDAEPTERGEDFGEVGVGPVFTGTIFEDSFFRLRHNIPLAANFRVLGEEGDERLRVQFNQATHFFDFSAMVSEELLIPSIMDGMEMDVLAVGNNPIGLTLEDLDVVFFRDGQEVDRLSGMEIAPYNLTDPGSPEGIGTFRFNINPPEGEPGFPTISERFDNVRFEATNGPNVPFEIDEFRVEIPTGVWSDIITSRIFGAEFSLQGPVGTTAQFFDLHGRPMVQTIALGVPEGGGLPLVDQADTGIPDFNDGIGRVVLTGTDSRSSFTLIGGTIEATNQPSGQPGTFWDGAFEFERVDGLESLHQQFMSAGFGYYYDPEEEEVFGLPPTGPGSVVIGAPFVRGLGDYNPGGLPPGFDIVLTASQFFNNPNHGVFVQNGASMGNVLVHGIVHGASRFTGAVDRINTGLQVGSIGVDGDLGELIVAGEAGMWAPDPDNTLGLPSSFTTGAELVVGRTVREVAVAGRSLLDVTVVGDLNTPTDRPAADLLRYTSREWASPTQTTGALEIVAMDRLFTFGIAGIPAPAFFGAGFLYHNDTILSSEFVGHSGTAVEINGQIGFADPFRQTQDAADVYAFPVDGTRTVVIQADTQFDGILRVMDSDGHTLAALEPGRLFREDVAVLEFEPPMPGVYYLAITAVNAGTSGENDGFGYRIAINGMAPVTFGSYRAGLGPNAAGVGLSNAINVLNGSMGAIRVGTGYVDDSQEEVSGTQFINFDDDLDQLQMLRLDAGRFTVDGNLYNVTVGSDIKPSSGNFATVEFFVGGDFGTLVTGISTLIPRGPGVGDVTFTQMTVGGHVGMLDVRGAIGIDQIPDGRPIRPGLILQTGTETGRGDIGMIRVGDHVGGGSLIVRIPDNSTVGAFLVAQDRPFTPNENRTGLDGGTAVFNTGFNADVRFVDFPRIDLPNAQPAGIEMFVGEPVELIDDAGGRVRITITGEATDVSVGFIRFLPITGSEGVAIATIDLVDLSGGRELLVEGLDSPGVTAPISIGRINIIAADEDSNVEITGNHRVDVYRIVQTGGPGLDTIRNMTPSGDIIAIDVPGLNELIIDSGNLGRTDVPAWGPQLIGPMMGVAGGKVDEVNGALGINPTTINSNWQGGDWESRHENTIYRPITELNTQPGSAFLDDLGGPFGPYLNGLVVRDGDVQIVSVGGAVGDVILQGSTGELVELIANSGNTPSALGEFRGIVGSIYAFNINEVDVGDGLRMRIDGPIANTGIYADNEIREVRGGRVEGAFISSNIIARNEIEVEEEEVDGIALVELTGGGDYIDAVIATWRFNIFWERAFYFPDPTVFATIELISGEDANFFRSRIQTRTLDTFELRNGFYDASFTVVEQNANLITATGYRNSTATGTDREFRLNEIYIGGNLANLQTENDEGEVADLTVDVLGSITGAITADNFTRARIEVDNRINSMQAFSNVRGTSITAGRLVDLQAGRNIAATSFSIAGPIERIEAEGTMRNTRIDAKGSNARIDLVRAGEILRSEVNSAGPVDLITSTEGDMELFVGTTTDRGTVNRLEAARDLILGADISEAVNALVAGRHIGSLASPDVILVRADLGRVDASSGQLYSTIRVGGDLGVSGNGTAPGVFVGRVSSRPGESILGAGSLEAFGRIDNVNIEGDFNGSIISWSGGIGSVTITDGSFFPGNRIAAYDGHIDSLVIDNGNLMGDVHADYDLRSLEVLNGPDPAFGHVGVNFFRSSNVRADDFRNELPPGVSASTGIDGATITAGHNIVSVRIDGNVFESGFHAGRNIEDISIGGTVRKAPQTVSNEASFFAAGDRIVNLEVGNNLRHAIVAAGLFDLGANGRPGGTGADQDTVRSGTIERLAVGNNMNRVKVTAGMLAGADGVYNTGDDLIALGHSRVESIELGGNANNVTVFSDTLPASIRDDNRFETGGTQRPVEDPLVVRGDIPGTPVSGSLNFSFAGRSGTFTFSGPGQAIWDQDTGTLILRNTTSQSSLTVEGNQGIVRDIRIGSTDNASIGTLNVLAEMRGESSIVIDNTVGTLRVDNFNSTGRIRIGGDASNVSFGTYLGGTFGGRHVDSFTVDNDYGHPDTEVIGEAKIDLLSAGSINFGGEVRAAINVFRDADSITVGAFNNATVRFGGDVGSVSADAFLSTWFSVRNNLGPVSISGDLDRSLILAGGDLGADSRIGGTGLDADQATIGNIASVTVGGNMSRSSIVAGSLRGTDGFFGTPRDSIAAGRSTIGDVSVAGSITGSSRFSESYRISATGEIGNVTSGGAPFSSDGGNMVVEVLETQPQPIQVIDQRVSSEAQVFTARLQFNQPINIDTLSDALSVRELRGETGQQQIFLVEGLDYTLSYDADENAALVRFSRDITEKSLPRLAGDPGRGVYRFVLDSEELRAQVTSARLDGNGDGFATGQNYAEASVVGAPGDKIDTNIVGGVSFLDATNLNLVLQDPEAPTGLPRTNTEFRVDGSIGNHPDHDIGTFRFAGDVDVYKLTLQAGQILRLGALSGPAAFTALEIITPSGAIQPTSIGLGSLDAPVSADLSPLPRNPAGIDEFTLENNLLVRTTGTYYIVLGNSNPAEAALDPSALRNIPQVAGGVGDYSFTLMVYDDGNTGFNAPTDAGDGDVVVNAPRAAAFAGADGQLNTDADLDQVVIGDFVFTLDPGPDGIKGTADDIITGTNGMGIVSTRFGDGRLVSNIDGAIGLRGFAGVPNDVFPDIDVYHLNNRNPIQPGQRLRITVSLSEFGADLGSRIVTEIPGVDFTTFEDFSGPVEFAVFDTTGAQGLDDANLLFSPTDFSPNGGETGVIADNGESRYGFNDDGDFFIEFVNPGRQGPTGPLSNSLAVYLQGVFNTDYQIEVVTHGTGDILTRTQNIYLELNGGTIDWLQAGGQTTRLDGFDLGSVGFTGGLPDGRTVEQYVTDNLVSNLQSIFDNAGFNVNISTNSADFEFQDFSTVYISDTVDPVSLLFDPFSFFAQFTLGGFTPDFTSAPFGFAQHSDPLNIDRNDEAVVFVPSLARLGYTPSLADLDNLTDSITAAAGRHIGELLGLRVSSNVAVGTVNPDLFAANAVNQIPRSGGSYQIPTVDRFLSDIYDSVGRTEFFLGQQNAGSLLDRVLART